jgi:RimJ/RimL family protein N-acetyltransferase
VKQIDEQVNAASKSEVNASPRAFELQPLLAGATLTLQPLHANDFEILYAAAADPLIWEQNPDRLRYERAVFERFFASAMASGGAFLVRANATGNVIGSSRYYAWDPVKQEVAIGYTFLVRSHWGGAASREMKTPMLNHAFKWAQLVWFHIGQNNMRSRKAMARIGGEYSHNAPTELNGVIHDYAFYKITRPADAR